IASDGILKVWARSGSVLFPSAKRAGRLPRALLVTMRPSKPLAFDDSGAATNAWQRTAQAYHWFDEILSSLPYYNRDSSELRAVLVGSAWLGASRGSVMQIVVPFPGPETSVILPPSCCVTRLWTMYRPSPILPCARLVVKKGSK